MSSFNIILLILSLSVLINFAFGTPDCYNFTEGITKKWNGYEEIAIPSMSGKRMDWLTINSGKNCGFYTFSDVYFNSFNSTLAGIYLRFVNTSSANGTWSCSLESPSMYTFTSGTWLYANSRQSQATVCGYYVGIANSDTTQAQAFQIIRLASE